MQKSTILTTIFIALIAGFLGVWLAPRGGGVSAPAHKETAYERVMRTGVLRCGYIIWPPYMDRDLVSGQFSGMNYDYIETVAKRLGLKVEWAEEILPGNQVEALRTKKIDVICTAEGPMVPSTIKYIAYSKPLAYVPFYLYARVDDMRFDSGIEDVNNPKIKIAVIDGDVSGQVASIHFPKASHYAMPPLLSPSQMMIDVASKKADIVINDQLSMTEYFANNPDKLKRISDRPIAVFPNTFSVMRGEEGRELLELLNQAIENVKDTGEEEIVFSKYIQDPKQVFFYHVNKPYEAPQ